MAQHCREQTAQDRAEWEFWLFVIHKLPVTLPQVAPTLREELAELLLISHEERKRSLESIV